MQRSSLASASALLPVLVAACADPALLSDRRFVTRGHASVAAVEAGSDATGSDASGCSGGACDATEPPCEGEACECPGLTDAATRATLGAACDGGDADACEDGRIVCDSDGASVLCDDDATARTETCNGADDDCDGQTDEDAGCTPATPARVCYPGVSFNFDVCFDLVPASAAGALSGSYPAATGANDQPPAFFLDTTAAGGATKLAANFALSELMPASAGRYAVFRPLALAHLQRTRAALGVPLLVDAAFLPPTGTAPHAGGVGRHPYGDAVDLRTSSTSLTLADIQRACEAEGADFTQVYTTHVHCDWRDEPAGADFWPPRPRRLEADLDPWAGLWADVDVTPVDAAFMRLTARWSPTFDEGTPWVRWELRDPATGEVTVVEPAVSVDVPRGLDVTWQVGGVLEGRLGP